MDNRTASTRMNIFILLFMVSLSFGSLAQFMILPGVRIYAHDGILVLLILWMIRQGIPEKGGTLMKYIAAFVGVGVLSLLANAHRFSYADTLLSSLYLLRWTLYALLYVIVLSSSRRLIWLGGLYAMGVVVAGFGILQYVAYPDLRNALYLGWDPHFQRLFSTLLDPNFTGILLGLTFFLGLAYWKNKAPNHWLYLSQILLFVALLLTYSRGSYLAFITGCTVWSIIKKRWHALAVGIAICVLAVFLLPKGGEGRDLFRTVSTVARFGSWAEGARLFAASPIIGNGFNTLRLLRGEPVISGEIPSHSSGGFDSSLLVVLATTGVIGGIIYVGMLGSMARIGRDALRRGSELGAIYLSALSGILVHSVFVNSLFYPWVMIWVWVVSAECEKDITSNTSQGVRR
ncbi:MAG: O-antigen ligase family protein [bacterium]|nr:O-antigen ligase family protein [bacterium]